MHSIIKFRCVTCERAITLGYTEAHAESVRSDEDLNYQCECQHTYDSLVDIPVENIVHQQDAPENCSELCFHQGGTKAQHLAGKSVPDIEQFMTLIWGDVNLQPVVMNLVMWKPMLREYMSQGAEGITQVQTAWQMIKSQLDSVNPALSGIVEAHAATSNVPLV